MSTLLLRLSGPLQSWGDSSRFTRRATRSEPTKSGILGLLAAAQGRRRTDPIEDLVQLRFGVRIDQRGRLLRDFHTAHSHEGVPMPLSQRYYLADATFLAGVEGDGSLIEALAQALRSPRFPLFLGRRACTPSEPVFYDVVDGDLISCLRSVDWLASPWYRRQQAKTVDLELVVDAGPGEGGSESVRDVPVAFDPRQREWAWRDVVRPTPVHVVNPEGKDGMDFLGALGGH